MLDHIGISVSDLMRSKAFYMKALKPLGYAFVLEVSSQQAGEGTAVGFGREGRPQFWIGTGNPTRNDLHIAFEANSREAVRAFYDAAIAAGGRDNGAPGLRPHYHENYYGAFVFDPDGHNVEAVCHRPGTFENQFAPAQPTG